MKLILLLISFAVTFQVLQAQTGERDIVAIMADRIISDSINISPHRNFEKRIKIKPIDQSDSEVEIRFYKNTSLSNTIDLKIIKLQNGDWQAVEYDEWNKPIKIKKRILAPASDFNSILKSLLDNNLLTLPDQSQLKEKMKKPTTINGRQANKMIMVSDGYSYTIEVKVGDNFRVYQFDNPKPYADFYDDVKELKDYVAIVETFEQQLK